MRMEKVLLSIVALSGLCAVSSPAKRQYHFVYDLKNMTEAQSYCREKYTDLATIDNMEDVKILNNMVDLKKMDYPHPQLPHRAWIGLYDARENWRWSLSDTSFYKQGETEFRRWGSGQPKYIAVTGVRHCTRMDNGGVWFNAECVDRNKAVCLYVRGPNVTFILINTTMTWTEAQTYCRDRYTDLASVRNMTDNQKVQELVSAAGDSVWIGLFADWKWSDGSNSSYRNWATGQPNNYHGRQTCVAAAFNVGNVGKWEDYQCHVKRAFICYSPPTTKQVIKLSLLKENPSLDLNDPAVMESILKQLKQRLKDQGVNDDIKLSWKKQPDGKVFHKEKKKDKKDEL
ncbi:macrophage mannose receptor 1-like [Sebastes umbrosus]|uniref:macrophage mannose receptor 1-like n=1 Tax=Sebastes umbrosus TaxID=72105 RepID=UPI0018A05B9B|nr:macrophage mannose receptor 1-like [Sebastes umbrosus]XP_037628797.1 macrophage mannose receptor 1-like [Sebastes umbrosus]